VALTKAERRKLKKQQKKAEQAKAAEQAKQAAPAPAQPAEKKKTESKGEAGLTKTLPGGLEIKDIEIGKGKQVKAGQRVHILYRGRLTNGKVFDQTTDRKKPFVFRLGLGEVISGWDKGIEGMFVGGKRKLKIPAPLAYGKKGAPPDIPPNATLLFDVEVLDSK